MIYRINLQHFLMHAIDHFDRNTIVHFNYVIISVIIKNVGRETNMAKVSELYPTPEIIINYNEYKNKDIHIYNKIFHLLTIHAFNRFILFSVKSNFFCHVYLLNFLNTDYVNMFSDVFSRLFGFYTFVL